MGGGNAIAAAGIGVQKMSEESLREGKSCMCEVYGSAADDARCIYAV